MMKRTTGRRKKRRKRARGEKCLSVCVCVTKLPLSQHCLLVALVSFSLAPAVSSLRPKGCPLCWHSVQITNAMYLAQKKARAARPLVPGWMEGWLERRTKAWSCHSSSSSSSAYSTRALANISKVPLESGQLEEQRCSSFFFLQLKLAGKRQPGARAISA